jgi:hypothetical protein
MRCSHPGSFEVARALCDRKHWDDMGADANKGEQYDSIVAGGGINEPPLRTSTGRQMDHVQEL